MKITVPIVVIAVASAFTFTLAKTSDLPPDSPRTQELLSKRVPVGTSIPDALHELGALGFACSPGTTPAYFYCDRTVDALQRWHVALIHAGGRITAVHASFGSLPGK